MELDLSKAIESAEKAVAQTPLSDGRGGQYPAGTHIRWVNDAAERAIEAALPRILEALAGQAETQEAVLYPDEMGSLSAWLRAKADELR